MICDPRNGRHHFHGNSLPDRSGEIDGRSDQFAAAVRNIRRIEDHTQSLKATSTQLRVQLVQRLSNARAVIRLEEEESDRHNLSAKRGSKIVLPEGSGIKNAGDLRGIDEGAAPRFGRRRR